MQDDQDRSRLAARALFWMCVVIAVNQLGFGALIPVLPLYAQSFGVPVSAIGATIAAYGLARMLCAVPGGHLSDRLGRRPALALGGLITGAGNLWCAWATSYVEFLAARFVAGAGAGMVVTIGTVILADISTPARRGRMMSVYQGAFLFAVGIGPLPGGLLAERIGLSAPFLAYAIAGLAVGAITWFAVPETRALGARPAHHAQIVLSFREQVRLLLAMPGFRLVSLVSFINAAVRTGALFNVVPLIGAVKLGLSPGQIGGAFAVGSVLGLAASYPAGVLTDRLGRKPVIVVANLFTAGSMLAYCLAPDLVWFTLACLVWGIATSVSGAAPSAYAADSAPPGMNAAAMSSFRMLADIGYVVGPLGLGLLVDLGSAEWTLAVSAALIGVVALWFGLRAPETWRGRG